MGARDVGLWSPLWWLALRGAAVGALLGVTLVGALGGWQGDASLTDALVGALVGGVQGMLSVMSSSGEPRDRRMLLWTLASWAVVFAGLIPFLLMLAKLPGLWAVVSGVVLEVLWVGVGVALIAWLRRRLDARGDPIDLGRLEEWVGSWRPRSRRVWICLARHAEGSWGPLSAVALGVPRVRALVLLQGCGRDVLSRPVPEDLSPWNGWAYRLLHERVTRQEAATLLRYAWGLEHSGAFGPVFGDVVPALQLLQSWTRFPFVSVSAERLSDLSERWRKVVELVGAEYPWRNQHPWDSDDARCYHGAQQVARDVVLAWDLLAPHEEEVALQVVADMSRDRFSGPDTFLQQVLWAVESVRGAFGPAR